MKIWGSPRWTWGEMMMAPEAPVHYGLSPIEKGKLRILQNEYLDPHFQLSILKYLGETVWSVSLSFIYLVRDE